MLKIYFACEEYCLLGCDAVALVRTDISEEGKERKGKNDGCGKTIAVGAPTKLINEINLLSDDRN
jgi:hypothetical protein